MNKMEVRFAIKTRNGVIENVGRSYVEQPKVKYRGSGIKWFDDTRLIKKGGAD